MFIKNLKAFKDLNNENMTLNNRIKLFSAILNHYKRYFLQSFGKDFLIMESGPYSFFI